MFDELIVLIAYNPNKKALFSVEDRVEMIEEVIRDCKNVRVDSFSGLLVDYVKGRGPTASSGGGAPFRISNTSSSWPSSTGG